MDSSEQQRLALTRMLAQALRESQNAVVGMDLALLERGLVEQEALCLRLRQLQAEPRDKSPQKPVSGELAAAQREVHRLNRVMSALLRQARRSVNVLMNVLAGERGTYGPPPAGPQLGRQRA